MHPHLLRLTPLRFIAALLVVVFHYGQNVFPFNTEWAHAISANGYVAVSFFFCLSGFIMATVYQTPMNGFERNEYWLARVARIYPVYLLCLAIGAASWETPLSQALMHIFLIQAWLPGYALSLNAPGWSLSVEALFYFVFPFLVGILRRKNLVLVGFFVAAVWFATQSLTFYLMRFHYQGFPSRAHDLIFYFPLMHLNEFLVGAFAGAAFHRRKAGLGQPALICIGAIAAVHGVQAVALWIGFQPILSNGLYAPYFVAFIWIVACLPRVPLLEHRWAVALGESSYALYLLQMPLMNPMLKYMKGMSTLTEDQQFFASAGVLIVAALIVYFAFERPMRSLVKRAGRRVLTDKQLSSQSTSVS